MLKKPTKETINFDLLTYKELKILTNYLSKQGKILFKTKVWRTNPSKKGFYPKAYITSFYLP